MRSIAVGTKLRVRSPWDPGEVITAEVVTIGPPQGKGWVMLTLSHGARTLYSPAMDIELEDR